MSVCVCCLEEFTKGEGNKRGFCSLECWRRYEKETASHNCLGVGRMNAQANNFTKNKKSRMRRVRLEDLIEDVKKDFNVNERFTVQMQDFSPSGKKHVQEFLVWLKAFKIKNNIS